MATDTDQQNSPATFVGVILISIAALLTTLRLFGRNEATPTEPSTAVKTEATAADGPRAILEKMVARYQATKAYADQGRLRLSFTRSQRVVMQSWPMAVQFVRPGRLKVNAYQLVVASDQASTDKRFQAVLQDPETNDLDGQVVSRPAPEVISWTDLLSDPLVAEQMSSRLQRPPVQLELLLTEKPLKTLFENDVALRRMEAKTWKSVKCERIEAVAPEGSFVFWIDPEHDLLMKLEFPVKNLLPDLAQDPTVSKVSLVAEFDGATFEPKVGGLDFNVPLPAKPRFVTQFVPPPPPASASSLGKKLAEFELVSLGGEKITPAGLRGKVVALYWYAHHPLCAEGARKFADALAGFKDNSGVAGYLVCTEAADTGDQAVTQQLREWGVSLTPARDLKEYRASVFGVRDLPSVALLDADGKLAALLSGSQNLASLPLAIRRVQQGDDLAAETLRVIEKNRADYEKLITSGGVPTGGSTEAVLPEATTFDHFRLTTAWTRDDIATPSGIWVDAREPARIYVVSAGQEVVEIDTDGKKLNRYPLGLGDGEQVSRFRMVGAGETRRGALFEPQGRSVVLVDNAWKVTGRYPSESNDARVIDAAWLLGAEANESLLAVAFEESVGLHGVNLKGERQWVNRNYLPIFSVAASRGPTPELLLTGQGGVCPVNRFGNHLPEKTVAGWSVAELRTTLSSSDQPAGLLGFARNQSGESCLIGLSEEFAEQWNYPVANWNFTYPYEFLASGVLRPDSTGEWVAAGPDGSLHVVAADGSFSDSCFTGHAPRGVAIVPRAEKPLLILTTATSVHAWTVEPK